MRHRTEPFVLVEPLLHCQAESTKKKAVSIEYFYVLFKVASLKLVGIQ